MTRGRWLGTAALAALLVAGGGTAAWAHGRHAATGHTFSVSFGGDASSATTSGGVASGQTWTAGTASATIVNRVDGQPVICSLFVDGKLYTQHTATGAGSKAVCAYP